MLKSAWLGKCRKMRHSSKNEKTIVTARVLLILLYCSRCGSVAKRSIPLLTSTHFCNSSRTKTLSFPIAHEQRTLFFFQKSPALLQPQGQNIFPLRMSCSQADDLLTVSVKHYRKRITGSDKPLSIRFSALLRGALRSVLRSAATVSQYKTTLWYIHGQD